MKVRISYGIDLAKTPSKVADLLLDAEASLREKLEMLSTLQVFLKDEKSMPIVLECVDSIRRSFSEIDATLADAQSMSEGFVKVMAGDLPTQQSEAVQQPQEPNDVR